MLETRVFNLNEGRYRNLVELAKAMGTSTSQLDRVRQGNRTINQKFIEGAAKAFPEKNLGKLFYLSENREQPINKNVIVEGDKCPVSGKIDTSGICLLLLS
jgi:hypothetical protein